MYNEDYVLRQIQICSQTIGKLIFNKDFAILEVDYDNIEYTSVDDLEAALNKCIDEDKINEAEEILFEYVNKNPSTENFQIAMRFYRRLNELSDAHLLNCNFSKEEILQGIEDIKKIYSR